MSLTETIEITATDAAGIGAAVLDYIEGWYESRPERTERSLHPKLAKRQIALDQASGQNTLHEIDAPILIGYVRDRINRLPPTVQVKKIEILAVYGDIASVQAEMNDWVDLLHLGRFADGWKIVNALWALKPKGEAV